MFLNLSDQKRVCHQFFCRAFAATDGFAAADAILGANVFAATDLVGYLDIGRGYLFLGTNLLKQYFLRDFCSSPTCRNPSKFKRLLNRT